MVIPVRFELTSTGLKVRGPANWTRESWYPVQESNPHFGVRSSASFALDERDMLVLHTGLEPVLDGFWIHFLCLIGILEQIGGFCRIRTCTHRLNRALLYRWSYEAILVGRVGLEPTRFRVSGLQPPAVAAVPPADIWSEWRDSNSRLSGPRPDALAKLSYAPIIMVDLVGLEPTLPCLQGRCFPSKLQAHNWCSRQDSNLHCTDSHSAFSAGIGILEHVEQ